ncbi:copper amine oxidase N-terminal domain-containing protein [Neobacillus pocheonensis]|uniref:copper amine oxidase N-terminal domain-containing protein n=1 Tax=Neobacillus pocheonensis TaxID=363869 RepID=UPI003D26A7E3
MKKIIPLLMLLICFTGITSAAASDSKIEFQVNEKEFSTPAGGAEPYINKDGRTMVAIRFLSNALGVTDDNISWDRGTETATIKKGNTTVQVTVGQQKITVNGSDVLMDTSAENTGGNVFIPVRFISEALGAKIEWDENLRKIFILSDNSNNLVRYGIKMDKQLPVKIQGAKLSLALNNVWIYPAGSNEFYDWVSKFNINVAADTKYIVVTGISFVNNSNGILASKPESSDSPWFVSASYGDVSYPEYNVESSDNEYIKQWSLKPGEKIEGFQIYQLNAEEVGPFVLYLEDGALTKEISFVKAQ